jgi:hypothetical protein
MPSPNTKYSNKTKNQLISNSEKHLLASLRFMKPSPEHPRNDKVFIRKASKKPWMYETVASIAAHSAPRKQR